MNFVLEPVKVAFVEQIRPTWSQWLRQNHPSLLHRRSKETKLGRDLGAGWETRHQRVRCPREKGRLHAPGDSPLRRIHDQGDYDVLRLDIRYVHG